MLQAKPHRALLRPARTILVLASGCVLHVLCPATVSAQLASASTAALAMGDNYTAAAWGYAAVAWNPALLAASANTPGAMTLLTGRAGSAFGPITLGDLAAYADERVPDDVKRTWLERVSADGAQRGSGRADLTLGAAQIGRFGFQATTSLRSTADLPPDVVRLVLFGNVDSDGAAATLDVADAALDVVVYSTAAFAYGHAFTLEHDARLMIGAAATITRGHVLVTSSGSSGGAQESAFDIDFPLVTSVLDPDSLELNNGNGMGLDVGFALESGLWTLGAAVQNVFNSFEWNEDNLRYRPYRVAGSEGVLASDMEERPLETAPAAVRTHVADLGFARGVAIGAAYRRSHRTVLSGDVRVRGGGGIRTDARVHVGAGAQHRLGDRTSLRAGAAVLSFGDDEFGAQLGAGIGRNVGGWNLSVSALHLRTRHRGGQNVLMATIFGTGMP